MSAEVLRIRVPDARLPALRALPGSAVFGPFEFVPVSMPDLQPVDATLVEAKPDAWWPPESAGVVITPLVPDARTLAHWLARGAQEVIGASEFGERSVAPRLRAAVERQRHLRETRTAYATDLGTGLPHRQQLIEHMSHLIALRERQPAPMAVVVLRVEGIGEAAARRGNEAANVLRRKLAVKLRGCVRASDVVASLGDDCFAVLLAALLAPADADLVSEKLLAAVRRPLLLGGQEIVVAAALGIAQHPQDGRQPEALLGRAEQRAAAATAAGSRDGEAANDPG